MMKVKKAITMLVLLVGILPVSHAILQLELTQGIDAAMPIVVLPFAQQAQTATLDVGQVIGQDLQNSGRFKTISSSGKHAHDANSLDKAHWRQQGANDAVVGSMQALPDGRYRVSYALVNLYATAAKGANPETTTGVLAQQSFTVTAARLRGLAHYIADQVFLKITGKRGIFSTKLAYVLVSQQATYPYQLQVADYDGFNPQTIFRSRQPIMSPTWSPDGKSIAYVTFAKGRAAIYVNDLRTGGRRLISRQFGVNGAPAFSPDGSRMALALSRQGHVNIFIKQLSTGKLQQVTNNWSINTEPVWSPDGKTLLFTSDRGGTPQIYRVNLSDGKTTRLTYDGNYNARATFLPGGKGIIVLHREQGQPYGIASKDLSSEGFMQILSRSSSKYTQSPSVAPNGDFVVYSTRTDNGNGPFVLAMVSTDNKVQITLPAQEGNVREPTWSPFFS